MIYFQLFNLPANFNIDTTTLAKRYRDLQRTVHPDKFANASDQERRLAMQKSTQINAAFSTLKHPLKRAQYILQENNIDASGEVAGVMDNAFLFEQIELRETLENLAKQADSEKLVHFMDDVDKRILHLLKILTQHFVDEALELAKEIVLKLQFLYKLQEEVLNLE